MRFTQGRSNANTVFAPFGDEVVDCTKVLRAIGADEPETLEALFALARCYKERSDGANSYHPEPSDAATVVSLLKEVGSYRSKAKQAVPLVEALKFDQDKSVRQAASDALRKLNGE